MNASARARFISSAQNILEAMLPGVLVVEGVTIVVCRSPWASSPDYDAQRGTSIEQRTASVRVQSALVPPGALQVGATTLQLDGVECHLSSLHADANDVALHLTLIAVGDAANLQ